MSRHDPVVFLRHMVSHGREAMEIAAGRTRDDLDKDRVTALALIRLLEIIGEAASHVAPEVRRIHPEVPWQEIVSLRNRLIHAYDRIDLNIVWEVLTQDLPQLVEKLDAILHDRSS